MMSTMSQVSFAQKSGGTVITTPAKQNIELTSKGKFGALLASSEGHVKGTSIIVIDDSYNLAANTLVHTSNTRTNHPPRTMDMSKLKNRRRGSNSAGTTTTNGVQKQDIFSSRSATSMMMLQTPKGMGSLNSSSNSKNTRTAGTPSQDYSARCWTQEEARLNAVPSLTLHGERSSTSFSRFTRDGVSTPDAMNHLLDIRKKSTAIMTKQKRLLLKKKEKEEAARLAAEAEAAALRKKRMDMFRIRGVKAVVNKPKVINLMKMEIKPFVKFRRVARAVKMLIEVCHACKSLLADSVAQESWFALADNLAAAAALTQDKKKGRAFITFVPNENRELEQLSFDVTEFMRHRNAEDCLTDEVRLIMKQRPGTRTEDQLLEMVHCVKGICKSFNEYPLHIQKSICQRSFFDKYRNNRVILRQGLAPDGIYFLLSGQLIEKPEGRKQPTEINAGEKFGEEDLVCGRSRRATVLSKNEVELIFLHRVDYMTIFNMSNDTYDSKTLDICKSDAVFQHFPMQKLIDNPGTWSSLKYKYGRLIVKDSNELEWIYVIKSGEARVLKHLEPGTVDVKARRKKIQQTMEEQSPYHRKKRILDFVADGFARPSVYTQSMYHPGRIPPHASVTSPAHKNCLGEPSLYRANLSMGRLTRPKTSPQVMVNRSQNASVDLDLDHVGHNGQEAKSRLPNIKMTVSLGDPGDDEGPTTEEQRKQAEEEGVMLITMEEINEINDPRKPRSPTKPSTGKSRGSTPRQGKLDISKRPSTCGAAIPDRQRYLNKPNSPGFRSKNGKQPNAEDSLELPPFVQIETLHPGHTFGLRSCLEHDERGPSVSLVSGECELLAINKKFFMKHCDDALYSLIRLKAKPFPSQTELVDRLDANIQWAEFKQETLKEFLRHRARTAR